MKRLATSVVFLLLPTSVGLAAEAHPVAAIKALQTMNDGVNWDAKTAAVADVTCDGIPDTVVVGYERGAVWLGMVPRTKSGRSGKPTTTRFSIGRETQDSLCATPVRVAVYPIECEDEEGSLPGCKAVKGCSAFSLVDNTCDSFHFYWDSARKLLTWWRR